MGYMLEILNEVRRRPGMYIGIPSLIRLASFLRGYDYALLKQDPAKNDPLLELFRDWIHRRFQTTKLSWEDAIVQHCGDDRDAFRYFWELVDEFLNEDSHEHQDNGANSANLSFTKEPQA